MAHHDLRLTSLSSSYLHVTQGRRKQKVEANASSYLFSIGERTAMLLFCYRDLHALGRFTTGLEFKIFLPPSFQNELAFQGVCFEVIISAL